MTAPPCHCCAELRARLEFIEARLERLDPTPTPEMQPDLLQFLAAWPGGWFTSREVWQRAEADLDLWAALQAEGVGSVYRLGHWLGEQDGIERGGMERAGNQWRVCGML